MSIADFIVRLLVLPALLASVPTTASQAGTHQLRGLVHDVTSQPVEGAWIEVRRIEHGAVAAADFDAAPFASMRSGKDGRWAFSDLPDGTWVVTAVAGAAPHSDAELQQLARPQGDARAPAGCAVTRILRHFSPVAEAGVPWIDMGVATAPSTQTPLTGQLVGSFDPDRFGYEIRLTRATIGPGGVRMTSSVVSTGSEPGPPAPVFTTVPDRAGKFDFGALEVSEQDEVSVTTFPLDSAAAATDSASGAPAGTPSGARSDGVTTTTTAAFGVGMPPPSAFGGPANSAAYSSMVGIFDAWEEGIRIPLIIQRSIALRAVTVDGKPVTLTGHDRITYTVWGEDGLEVSSYESKSVVLKVLADGTYLARAAMGDFASDVAAFKVDAKGDPVEVALVLHPCSPFKVHLVDAKGAPLGECSLKLGTEASKGWPDACRIPVDCENGDVDLQSVRPGSYDVQFSQLGAAPFTQRIEFKRDGVPVVVKAPGA